MKLEDLGHMPDYFLMWIGPFQFPDWYMETERPEAVEMSPCGQEVVIRWGNKYDFTLFMCEFEDRGPCPAPDSDYWAPIGY